MSEKTFLPGNVTADNGDGTYDVTLKGKTEPYSSLSSADGTAFVVGESVNVFFPEGQRGMAQICGGSAWRG